MDRLIIMPLSHMIMVTRELRTLHQLECSKTITVNPETNEVLLDVNTIAIVPKAPTAGYVASSINEPGLEPYLEGKVQVIVVVDIIDNTCT